ncbi:glycosyltransferase family 4 protein [Ignisphaera sp. 4213-co]|uniref:Glycosyltransferase family 4 protein n=1 Tax=Ignisphaera cupida TaxID=3050454 RepID=A0ABD4Z663_9CREN|nr:glycosyltransferase family 4 protein [Ignisphaera sp. 4213-co]MDK6028807.1 glycosyltransferase family 4 protein [Ignisphaera sp. 4213-co]
MWRRLVATSTIYESLYSVEAIARYRVLHELNKRRVEDLLRRYDVVVAISKSIPYEMGGEWVDRVVSMDSGVSLDEDDINLIKAVRSRVREKENYIVFGGRPTADKGLAEAIILISLVAKRFSGLKLVVSGRVSSVLLYRLRRACRRLGVENNVVFTGFLPREKRFEVVAKARLMLYPSHIDSFSYAVLESLYLGTPVVGYRIPALEIYYGRNPGVKLVEEGDVEALTVEVLNVLEKGVDGVEPPKIRSWREIMDEEISIIKRAISIS